MYKRQGWGYVYGTYGEVLNEFILTTKISQFPEQVGENEEFIRQHWLDVYKRQDTAGYGTEVMTYL